MCFLLFQFYCCFLVLSLVVLVVQFLLSVVRLYFVLYLIWFLLVIFPSFWYLVSVVVGWYLLFGLVLEVRLTFCRSMIHLVCVLLYLKKVIFLVYFSLHHLLDCSYDSKQRVYNSLLNFLEILIFPFIP